MRIASSLILLLLTFSFTKAQNNTAALKFKQLNEEWNTPNTYRTASGAPGHQYYQQQVNYDIEVELDDSLQRIYGFETITYINKSPDILNYLWLQLDQNQKAQDADAQTTETMSMAEINSFNDLRKLYYDFDGGFKIEFVRERNGNPLHYVINKTMMRIDLPQPLQPGATFTFEIKYWYNINDRIKWGGRSGYEYFAEDGNYLYAIAQFYPRMAVYNDIQGWQHKQFLGRGEFTLNFGNYRVSITAPSDHVVAATGILKNPNACLTPLQRERLKRAEQSFDKPVIVITEQEAKEAEKKRATTKKTWVFEAQNVRDFAFASSRKFIWDAMAVKMGNRTVMAMSFYPKEGNPLWEQYSTRVVAHTLKCYSKYTFDYPYPVAISVHTDQIGMEYPMICFNGGRPEKDGTYSERVKYGMISVIIHEVGHNYFPMIVNSDERQWTWMDEGLNSFLQYLTEQEWERGYPSRRGPAHKIVDFMKGDPANMVPIMTNSESILQFGNVAYGKPAAALNILRETIMGRELFDFAFKTYAQRWMFKHPTPEDFFRTMEDASGVDLDWFWRGWFYGTEPVDIAIESVRLYKLSTQNPEIEKALKKQQVQEQPKYISDLRNQTAIIQTQVEADSAARDFYNTYDPFAVTYLDKMQYKRYLENLTEEEKKLLERNDNYYEIKFKNVGGLIMPIILEFEFEDGTKEIHRIPAEIWRLNDKSVTKVFLTNKNIKNITLDPYLETADIDTSNNYWPPRTPTTRIEIFKRKNTENINPMQLEKKLQQSGSQER
ncbi:MAG: M1 family metallopeptidase [Bacteroidia bacterium]|nr:M1 family metallopeptidase [Bacteroidia bacterium]MDW8158178.1 M1 family metallopeptidase [Bacteroidia bacterium]